ncbi:MAG TPA: alpha/beta hydrolase-fold protein [Kofleriaceae bacterium]|jgi:pimeloyl-ACP methyl ester carboxylesterase|nr:alpha/beta hydrolase-fold protein [Kofleriaceae bacterium]
MKGLALAIALIAVTASCGNTKNANITCGTGTMGTLSMAAPVAVTASSGDDLVGAQIAADAHTTIPSADLTIACSPDIAPDGYVALGPAVAFGAEGTWSDRAFLLTLPYKAARLPDGADRRHVRIVAQHPNGQPYFPPVSNRLIDDDDTYASRVTFDSGELTTYQVVAAMDAGAPRTETFAFNAIMGVSMGGNASMAIALRHPDKFDAFADMGGEPGPSMTYTLNMVYNYVYGGFCDAASDKLGQLCPNTAQWPEQYETAEDFEHLLYQAGSGVGLTLDRTFYMQGTRDIARAFGNPALYNSESAYAPPGVGSDYLAEPAATRCGSGGEVALDNFYDARFNPTGSASVITFCDGGDSAALGLGVFDPSLPQTDPAEITLAVDLNGNGKRDPGEPLVTQASEPYSDVGSDGLADVDEPGYDPVTNPDPDGDDYHYLRNPNGTEGNGTWDPGEPYSDYGLDGIQNTCQATSGSGCYDYGEGNGKWDLSPSIAAWYANDFVAEVGALTDAQRTHMGMWFDAGIRDFLNNSVSTNQAIGQALAKYQLPFMVYDNFGGLQTGANEATYDFTQVPWAEMPKNGYLRYGNPDASADEIADGDGRHVGTANEIIYRIESAFAYLNQYLPDGDLSDTLDGGQALMGQTFMSPSTGRTVSFAMFLPPGYSTSTGTYPVVYVLHGYGQKPDDLVSVASIVANYMISTEPLATRMQKFIMVFPDGECEPGSPGVPVTGGGDGCEQGTFFLDSPDGQAKGETEILELMDYIGSNYRTKQPATAMVTD